MNGAVDSARGPPQPATANRRAERGATSDPEQENTSCGPRVDLADQDAGSDATERQSTPYGLTPRDGRPTAHRRRANQHLDLQSALHERQDRQRPRHSDPDQTGRERPRSSGALAQRGGLLGPDLVDQSEHDSRSKPARRTSGWCESSARWIPRPARSGDAPEPIQALLDHLTSN